MLEHYPAIGARYVFFTSLKDSDAGYAKKVANYYSRVNSIFDKTPESDNQEQGLSFMKNYVNFIGGLAAQERNNEISFYSQYINVLKQNKTLDSSKITNELIEILKTSQNFDYIKFINLINKLRNGIEQYEDDLSQIIQRMKNLQKITSQEIQQEKERIKTLRSTNDTDNREITNRAKQNLRHQAINQTKTFSEQVAEKINQIIEKAFTSEEILTTIEKHLENKKSTQGLDSILENLVSRYVINNPNADVKDFFSQTEKRFQELLEQAEDDTYYTVFNKTKKIFIEEEILKGSKGISNIFLNFSPNTQQEIIQEYANKNNDLQKLYEELIEKFKNNTLLTQDKTRFTIALQKAIETKINLTKEEFLTKSKQEQNLILTDITSYLSNISYTIKVQPYQIGEAIAQQSADIQQIVDEAISSKVSIPGQKIRLKNDITLFYSFKSKNDEKTYIDQLIQNFENFMNDFLKEYNKQGKGETNVELAANIYLEKMQQISEEYKKIVDSLSKINKPKEIEELKNIISNSFLGGISVKEYTFADNKIGFHGGSLGGSGKVIDAIPNILKMYELGGITTIDAEIIIDALLNCANSMIGGQVLGDLSNFKNYLIGGAAMVMFDDGFSSAEAFLEKMKKMFDGVAPRGLHLYQLQNKFIPASYVLQNIYENLLNVVTDIENNLPTEKRLTSNKISSNLTISNTVSEDSFAKKNIDKDIPANWDTYSEFAQNTVTISFSFMAGILDIFEQLPNAFANVT